MAKSDNLRKAKAEKNDEFYTRLEDITAELCNYKKHFAGKVVLCNCDDPEWSNFWIYFHQNFGELKMKKLISTHYNADGSPSYKMEYSGGNDVDVKDWHQCQLKGNGDFRSDECIEILKEADIVVSNPPFSLWRIYVSLLMECKKKFVILGNMNCITYKEFFPLMKDNLVWPGYGFNLSMIYKTIYKNELEANRKFVKAHGLNPDDGYVKVPAICWFTNLDIPKRHYSLVDELHRSYEMNRDEYQKYDNYDAINVDKISEIPYDYFGVMGVPITFLDKYNPDEFEILGITNHSDMAGIPYSNNNCFAEVNGNRKYVRIFVKRKGEY